MQQKGILVIVNLDTRVHEFSFVRESIEKRGLRPIIMDFSMEMKPPYPGDITCEEVADAGGMFIEGIRFFYPQKGRSATGEEGIGLSAKIY